jgi:hypothetical protein
MEKIKRRIEVDAHFAVFLLPFSFLASQEKAARR